MLKKNDVLRSSPSSPIEVFFVLLSVEFFFNEIKEAKFFFSMYALIDSRRKTFSVERALLNKCKKEAVL